MGLPKKATLAILALLLSANAVPAQPAPPGSVVAEPYTGAEDEGEPGSFILLVWEAVEGADGYRIYREIFITTGVDGQGNVVELDSPEYVLVSWGSIDQPEGSVVRVVVSFQNSDTDTRWAVVTVQNTDDGPVQSEPLYFQVQLEGMATGVQARSWGAVKAARQKSAPVVY